MPNKTRTEPVILLFFFYTALKPQHLRASNAASQDKPTADFTCWMGWAFVHFHIRAILRVLCLSIIYIMFSNSIDSKVNKIKLNV